MNSVWFCWQLSPLLVAAQPQAASESRPTEIVISDLTRTAIPWPIPLLGASVSPARPAPRPEKNVIVVCPPVLLPALSDWIQYRQQQGYRTLQIDGRLPATDILATIRRFAHRQPVSGVLLVGDADLTMQHDSELRQRSVPTFFAAGQINAKLGAGAHIATDNPYGDLDGDQVPDLAVGRIPADSAEELSRIVRKIIDYEQLPRRGQWRRTVHLAAGVGDFGLLADTVIETAAKKFLADGIPAAYRTTMTYGNWRSPFCPDPRSFRESMLRRIDEGCLFWVYMGHGRPHRLDRFQVGETLVPVLEASDVPRFRASSGLPIAVLLACYTGAFDQPRDCLAEELLRTPQGPVAVLAASRVTLPYSMAVLGTSLMEAVFDGRNATLGAIVLRGKQALADEHATGTNRKLMDSLAKTLSPTKEELPAERREHQLLFNLLGDPLLHIEQPRPLQVDCRREVEAGQSLKIQGVTPIGGHCSVEIVCRRDRLTFSPPRRRSPHDHHADWTAMTETYERANLPQWAERQMTVRPGRFMVEVYIPEFARGPGHARVVVEDNDQFALGAADIYIQPPGSPTDLRTPNAER